MTNLEKFILELESQIKNGFIPNTGSKLKKLLEIIKVQNEALITASKVIDKVKYECYASVYTLEDDEMGSVFFARDYCDMARKKVEQIAGGDE